MGDMVKGNIAMAEAAIRAGMQLYAGYPITPSTEIMEYLSHRAPEAGRKFIQAESEMNAMMMVFGAASTGAKVLTATSGLGMSDKQEGISHCAFNEYPAVMINVVRYGDGLGTLQSGQTDYLRETRGGGNGDYRNIVLSPSSVQEACDLVYEAFDISQKYRNIVVILTEGALGQMMEDCDYPPMKECQFASWGFDGTHGPENHDPLNLRCDLYEHGQRMNEKRKLIRENEQRWESDFLDDAEYVFIAYGLPGRVVRGLVKRMRAAGEKVGYIRPISLWPYPDKAFTRTNPNVKGFISVETCDEGQMIEDVALSAKKSGFGKTPVFCIPCRPGVPTGQFIEDRFKQIKAGNCKEVY